MPRVHAAAHGAGRSSFRASTRSNKGGKEEAKQTDEGAHKPVAAKTQEFMLDHENSFSGDAAKDQAALVYLREVFSIDIDHLDQCYEKFCELDVSGSGSLRPNNYITLLQNMGGKDIHEKDIAALMAKVETGLDDMLAFDEFLQALSGAGKMERDASAMERKIRKLSQDMQRKMEKQRMAVDRRALLDGIKQSVIISYLEEEIAEANSCSQLPWLLLLLASFTMSFLQHFSPHVLHGIDQSIKYDIKNNVKFAFEGFMPFENGRVGHKNLDDVNNVGDFWSWLNVGLMPILYRETPQMSELRANSLANCLANGMERHECEEAGLAPLTPAQQTEYMLRNHVLGGIRLRQERADGFTCDGDFPYARVAECYSSDYNGYRDPSPTKFFGLDEDLSYDPQFIPTMMPAAELYAETRRLENEFWISEATQRVEVSFATYHPEKRVLTITYINFYISFGGRIWKLIKHCSVAIDISTVATWIFDFLWILQLLKMLMAEATQLVFVLRHSTTVRAGLKAYWGVWKVLDWIGFLMGFLLVALFIDWASHVSKATEYLYKADPVVQGSWSTSADRIAFFEKMDGLSHTWQEFKLFCMIYVFMIGFRFFESFNAQPRLALVTKTMERAAVDLVHFGIVFIIIFTIFSVAGIVLFAGDIAAFSDVPHAAFCLWRLILGDMDVDGVGFNEAFQGMVEAGELGAITWNLSFAILVYFLMLNMILAIVLDWYTEVKGAVGPHSETLWSQTYEIYKRWIDARQGKFIPLHEVVLVLDPTVDDEDDDDEDPFITPDSLRERVPKMSQEQASNIVIEAANFEAANLRDGASLSDAGNKIETTLDTVMDLHEQVQALVMLTTVITDAQMSEMKSTKKLMQNLGHAQEQRPSAFLRASVKRSMEQRNSGAKKVT